MQNFPLPVPVTCTLLELEKVRESSRLGRDSETPGLPGTRRNPGNGDTETVQVVSSTELCRAHLHCHKVETGGHVEIHLRGKLDIAAQPQGLGESVVCNQLIVCILVRPVVGE